MTDIAPATLKTTFNSYIVDPEIPVEMVWVDFETNSTHQYGPVVPFEIGARATDSFGRTHSEFRRLILPVDARTWIDGLAPVVREMHEKSGLLRDLEMAMQSPRALRDCHPLNIDREFQSFLDLLPVESRSLPMSGSTVFFDRRVMEEHLPNSHGWFTHRNIDVSTLKEACKLVNAPLAERYKDLTSDFVKEHRPLGDIDASIKEWLFYRDNFLWD